MQSERTDVEYDYSTLAKSPVTHHGSLKPVLTKSVGNPWRLAIGSILLSGNAPFLLMSPAAAATSVTSFPLPLHDISRARPSGLTINRGSTGAVAPGAPP